MTVLRKFIIKHDFLDVPEFTREFTPFESSMLNALHTATGLNHTDGVLTEHTDRLWEFRYTKNDRLQHISISMTDEMFHDKYEPEVASEFAKPKQPTFKL